MDRKIIGIGIGAVLVISLVTIMAFAFAQESKPTVSANRFIDADNNGVCDNAQSGNCPHANQGGFVDANNDGVCDNAANCPMHNANTGCNSAGGCSKQKNSLNGGCHRNAILTE